MNHGNLEELLLELARFCRVTQQGVKNVDAPCDVTIRLEDLSCQEVAILLHGEYGLSLNVTSLFVCLVLTTDFDEATVIPFLKLARALLALKEARLKRVWIRQKIA